MRRCVQLAAAAAALGHRRRRASAIGRRRRPSTTCPGVGENLQDHLEVYVQHACTQPVSLNPLMKWRHRPWIGLQWLFRKGPGTSNHFEAGGFIRSNDDVAYPNLMFHFLPDRRALRRLGAGWWPRLPGAHRPDVLRCSGLGEDHRRRSAGQAGAALQLPVHRPGSPGVGRGDPRSPSASSSQPAFAPFSGGEISPGPERRRPTRRSSTGSPRTARPPCTRRAPAGWAPTSQSVLDPLTMRVHGMSGVRVVDASAMPYVTNGNIYAPVMMLAEKAADLILGDTPLPPEPVEFYRHRRDPEPVRRAWTRLRAAASVPRCGHVPHPGRPVVTSVSNPVMTRMHPDDLQRGGPVSDDEFDEIDLATLTDDELVKQMHDDLYDGLADEIVEGTTILLDRGWGPEQGAQRRARRRDAHRRHRLPRRHPVRARGAAVGQRDEGRHGDPAAAARRDRRRADRQGRHRHREGRHPRHRQEPRGDDARGRRVRGGRPRHQHRRRQVPRRARGAPARHPRHVGAAHHDHAVHEGRHRHARWSRACARSTSCSSAALR